MNKKMSLPVTYSHYFLVFFRVLGTIISIHVTCIVIVFSYIGGIVTLSLPTSHSVTTEAFPWHR
jgi:hypothetical protein